MKKLAPAMIFLAVTGCNKAEDAIVSAPKDSVELFQACADYALSKTPEAAATISNDTLYAGSALSIDETSVHLNDTSLQQDEKGKVTASGPGAKTALSQYEACVLSL